MVSPKNQQKLITIKKNGNGGWYHAKVEGNGDTIQIAAASAWTTKSRRRPRPLSALQVLKASRRQVTQRTGGDQYKLCALRHTLSKSAQAAIIAPARIHSQ
jgi:hypothetical protein